ncbi:hypothetical protein FPQ18DRAFT_304986 [Pyronema domesticum]|nr:hypothetical protein FPQ18DRAFT_304986 [Pyronema domesticum]
MFIGAGAYRKRNQPGRLKPRAGVLEALRHTQTTTLANVSTVDPQTIVSAFRRPAPPEVFLDVINTIVWNETHELRRSDFERAGVGRCRCGDRFTVEKVDVR